MQKTITYQEYTLQIKTELVDVSEVTKKTRGSYRAIVMISKAKNTYYCSVPGFSKIEREAIQAGLALGKVKVDRGQVKFA